MGRRGLSLPEVVIAVLVLALALLPIVDVFSGASRQARQTWGYTLALAMETKVAEELCLASWENRHWQQALEGDRRKVVGGDSPFFRALEDDQPPYGELIAGQDAALSAATGAIGKQLAGYSLAVDARPRTLATTGRVVDLELRASWKDANSPERELVHPLTLPVLAPRSEPPALLSDRVAADDAVRRLLYPAENGRTLTEVAAARGAGLAALRTLGDLAVILDHLVTSRAARQTAWAQLMPPPGQVDHEAARKLAAIARDRERRAAFCLQSVAHLAGNLEALLAGRLGPLGAPPPPVVVFRRIVERLPELSRSLAENVVEARRLYTQLAYAPWGGLLGRRMEVRLLRKAIEVARLAAAIAPLPARPAAVGVLEQLLLHLATSQRGRNPNMEAYAATEREILQEKGILASQPEWRTKALEVFGQKSPSLLQLAGNLASGAPLPVGN